jgi:hypothetical protein
LLQIVIYYYQQVSKNDNLCFTESLTDCMHLVVEPEHKSIAV